MKNIFLIGTSHISKDSVNKTDLAFSKIKPDIIAVELDRSRYSALKHPQNQKTSFNAVFKIGLTGYLFLILGRYVQKKLGSVVGMEPGKDVMNAIDLCEKNKLRLALVDRDISITLKRLSKKFSFREKIRFFLDIFISPFSKKRIAFDISKIPEQELISHLIKELKGRYPNLYEVLIEERNKYIARKLFKLAQMYKNKKILCVLGAGHEEGVEKHLRVLYNNNLAF